MGEWRRQRRQRGLGQAPRGQSALLPVRRVICGKVSPLPLILNALVDGSVAATQTVSSSVNQGILTLHAQVSD